MAETTPDRLTLLTSTAGQLFEEIAATSGLPADSLALKERDEELAALTELGLVRVDEDGLLQAVDPQVAQGALVGPMSARAGQLVAEVGQWSQAFSALGQVWRRSAPQQGPVLELRGDAIRRYLVDLMESATEELLSAQPETDRATAPLRQGTVRDLEALDRGVRLRVLFQHAARRSRPTRAYVARVTEAGGEVRTMADFFDRLVIVDRAIAVIPAHDEPGCAVAVRDPHVVSYLVDLFERKWSRGRPYLHSSDETVSAIAAEQREMAVRMLVEGLSDQACAHRMGVSPRTYATYLAGLKSEYDAQTRFQLGYRMGLEAARAGHDGRV